MKRLLLICFLIFFTITNFNLVLGSDSGGIGIVPLTKSGEEKRSWFIYNDIKPGAIIKDQVVISNTSKEAVDLLIYTVDAHTTPDGGYAPDSDDATVTDVGKWSKLSESSIHLQSGESKLVDFTITVPAKVGIGDHFGTILVKRKNPAKVLNKDEKNTITETGYNLVVRVGSRIYLTVAGALVKKLSFDKLTFDKQDKEGVDTPFFNFSITNDGNVRLTPNGRLEIYDTKTNELVDSFNINLREIFPYTSTVVPIEWVNQKTGEYKAKAIVYGYEPNQVFNKEINFKWAKAEGNVLGGKDTSNSLIIFLILIIIFLGLFTTYTLFKTKKRR